MIQKINNEIEAAKSGKKARIIIKVNSLIDPGIIKALYTASVAGVQVDLVIRGICGLVPNVKGLSENIRVRSLLGRFLEHSRVYYFKNSPQGETTYLGSADWMPRNFFRRVEVVFPVEEKSMESEILQTMENFLLDNTLASELKRNGDYLPASKRRKTLFSVQENLISFTKSKAEQERVEIRSGSPPRESQNQGKTH
jgi:polyphosphate kinase